MSKKKVKLKENQISDKKHYINTDLKSIDYDSMNAKIAFESVDDNKCSLSDWHGKELKLLIDCFKKIETSTWRQIQSDTGLNFERNKNIAIPLPSNFPPDANLCSIRVNQKMRLYGYRVQEFFYIVWFDKNHIVCPMGKSKKYTA
jgi:hypothetical protein